MIVVSGRQGAELWAENPLPIELIIAEMEKLLPDGKQAVFLCGESLNGELGRQIMKQLREEGRQAIETRDLSVLEKAEVIVDCLHGCQLDHVLSNEEITLIETVNNANAFVLALDVPSGLNSDNGALYGACIKADVTLTLQAPKTGLYFYPGSEQAGKIIIAGQVNNLTGDMFINNFKDIAEMIPVRKPHSHKGTYGKVLLIGGGPGMSGACLLAAKAILRCGAGMLTVMCHEEVWPVIGSNLPEAMTIPFTEDNYRKIWAQTDLSRYTLIAIGPGLGRTESTEYLLNRVLATELPCVIDADGLFFLQGHQELLNRKALTVITPHAMEYQRIFGFEQAKLIADLKRESLEYPNLVIVYKCEHTLIAHQGHITINTTGNNAMAKGGSGDVLCGLTAAFTAQRTDEKAVIAAVYLHSLAADQWLESHSSYSLLPSDLIAGVDRILLTWQKEQKR